MMAETIFKYSKLADATNDIRLVTLLPGKVDDHIKLRISHVPLQKSTRSSRASEHRLEHVRETLPDGWEAFEALDGRILFTHKDTTGTTSTSWEHPDPNYALSFQVENETNEDQSLAQVSVYEALSYIWGAEDNPLQVLIEISTSTEDMGEVLIEISGSSNPPKYAKLSVRQNLEGSLRHLRYTDTPRTLWIDAICINQDDISERGEQVSRMKDIFKSAERVMVWIGPATDDSQHAMQTLNYLGRQVVHSKARTCAPAPDAVERTWFQATVRLPFDDKTWKAIGDLLRRPWFERLWVVQEAHLARKGVFLCGNDELDWLTFRYAILVFWYNKASLSSWPSTMRLIGQLVESMPEKHPISDLLYQVYGRACTDPRDRVYGIHGLFPRSFQKLIQPDYSLTVGDVYKTLVIAHINFCQRLESLRLCHPNRSQGIECPSWVPDLSSALNISRRMDWQFAAGYSSSQAYFDSPNVLNVTGIHCATVTHTYQPLPKSLEVLESLRLVREWEPEDLDSGSYPTGESVRDAYARLLLGNSVQDRYPERVYDVWFKDWKNQDSPTALFGAAARTPLSDNAMPNGFEKTALSMLTGRSFMTTSEGFLGLGPSGARQGNFHALPSSPYQRS
jgi:hypothetical protein